MAKMNNNFTVSDVSFNISGTRGQWQEVSVSKLMRRNLYVLLHFTLLIEMCQVILQPLFYFFKQQFFLSILAQANFSPLSGFCILCQVFVVASLWLLQQFLGLCCVLHSIVFCLCTCYLTTSISVIICLHFWDMRMLVSGKTHSIFIQYILIFALLNFSNFLLYSIQNTSSKFVKYIC